MYAVRFGSEFSDFGIICGSSRSSHICGDSGVQMIPEVWRTMNAICAAVILLAAMMRSPSFSRSGESRTTRKEPARKESMHDSIESNWGSGVMSVGGCVCGTKLGASADRDIVPGR